MSENTRSEPAAPAVGSPVERMVGRARDGDALRIQYADEGPGRRLSFYVRLVQHFHGGPQFLCFVHRREA